MKRQIVGRVVVSLLATSVLCLIPAGVAAAGGGKSAIAKICQKGGWESLLTASGAGFTSEGACVSSGAQGGGALGVSASVANGRVTFRVSGFGLLPGSPWGFEVAPGESLSLSVPADGIVSLASGAPCGVGSFASAGATTSTGAVITTPIVNSPCR